MILIHKTSKQSLFEQRASIILSQCLHKADDVFENIQECSCRLVNILVKKMGEFGGQNAHSTLNTDCKSSV